MATINQQKLNAALEAGLIPGSSALQGQVGTVNQVLKKLSPFPKSIATLSRETGLSENSIAQYCRWLEDKNLAIYCYIQDWGGTCYRTPGSVQIH